MVNDVQYRLPASSERLSTGGAGSQLADGCTPTLLWSSVLPAESKVVLNQNTITNPKGTTLESPVFVLSFQRPGLQQTAAPSRTALPRQTQFLTAMHQDNRIHTRFPIGQTLRNKYLPAQLLGASSSESMQDIREGRRDSVPIGPAPVLSSDSFQRLVFSRLLRQACKHAVQEPAQIHQYIYIYIYIYVYIYKYIYTYTLAGNKYVPE